MMQKLAIFTTLVVSMHCMVIHQAPIPVSLGVQYHEPNYNFAYEVNDAHTGDIKNQHESRRGDTVLGQYSLVQPDGVRRTVDYRADEHAGFRATVNNDGRPSQEQANNVEARPAHAVNPAYIWPAPTTQTPPPAVAISRSSLVQTFSAPVQTFSAPVQTPAYGNYNQYSSQYGSNPWL